MSPHWIGGWEPCSATGAGMGKVKDNYFKGGI